MERLEFLYDLDDDGGNAFLYALHAHALKSALSSIGAVTLAKQAANIEAAGKKGDMQVLNENMRGFTTNLKALVERIKTTLRTKHGNENNEFQTIDKTALLALKEALINEDINAIDKIIEDLYKLNINETDEENLSNLSTFVLTSDFDKALKLLEGYLL
jgi:HPt (histidine-containing phosphotransfer) domain-containing protein